MSERVRLGELLVETGLISKEQLASALELQKTDPRRLGEIVIAVGMVSEAKVTQILSQQLSVPWVSLEYVDFSRQLLNLVSSETAQKHTLVPIYVRRSKQRRETLFVAIEDPSNQEALDEVADFSGLPVRPMIAPPSDIRGAIRAYYLGLPPEASSPPRVPVPSEGAVLPPPVLPRTAPPSTFARVPTQAATAPAPETEAGTNLEIDPVDDIEAAPESVELRARDTEMPNPTKPDAAPKMITLTMLDGTEMKLPASPRAQTSEGTSGELTARDLVEALRAEGGGHDLSEVLGTEVNWQRMFAALLSIMLKKHLILDWEFVRELKR